MYTHILIPTDGSELAGKAAQHRVILAKRIDAQSYHADGLATPT